MASVTDQRLRMTFSSLVLFCFAMFLTAKTARDPSIAASGSVVVGEVLAPAQSLNRWFVGGISGVWEDYFALMGVQQENIQLKSRLAVLEQANSQLLEMRHEVHQLRDLLSVETEDPSTRVSARVIGYDATQWVQSITLDRGSNSGIRIGMAVVARNGLVGQVMAVSPRTARVLLITDPASGVDGIIQNSRARGTVRGAGAMECVWQFVMKDEQVEVGDRLITSGLDGVYPRGIPIGVVSSVESRGSAMFRSIEVTPAVDFSLIDYVLIITSNQPDGVSALKPLSKNSGNKASEGEIVDRKASRR